MKTLEEFIANVTLFYIGIGYKSSNEITQLIPLVDRDTAFEAFNYFVGLTEDTERKICAVELREYKAASSSEYTIHKSWKLV
jgi:hypothetical protein